MDGFINMRNLLLFALILSIPAFAKNNGLFKPGKLTPFQIEGVGAATAKLTKTTPESEKAGLPLQLELYFTCKDNRSIPNSVLPEPQRILKNLTLCHFYWPPTFDSKTQKMTIYYSLPSSEKDGSCSEHRAIDFTLNDTCEVWQR